MGSVWDIPFPVCVCVCVCVPVCLCVGRPKGALEAAVVDWRAHVWCGWEIKHTLLMNVRAEGSAPFLRFWSRLGCSRFITHTHTHTCTCTHTHKHARTHTHTHTAFIEWVIDSNNTGEAHLYFAMYLHFCCVCAPVCARVCVCECLCLCVLCVCL